MLVSHLEVSAPGKLILCGEHSVVYGKKALASAIDLRTRLTARRSSDRLSTFNMHLLTVDRLIQVTEREFTAIGPVCSLDEGVNKLLAERADREPDKQLEAIRLLLMSTPGLKWAHLSGLCVEVSSELPLAAGLGSSASLSVCLAAMFHLLITPHVQLLTEEERNDINTTAFAIERIFHGQPSGIDNSVACYGNYVVFERGAIIDRFTSSLELPIVVVNSRVAKQTCEQVLKVRRLRERHPVVVDALMNSINEIVTEFVIAIKNAGSEPDELVQRINDLVTLNQGILHSLQVNNLQLANIIGLAAKYGLHGKITGSGGGGCCFIMLDHRPAQCLLDELTSLNFVSFPTKLGCQGVTVENIEF